MADAYGITSGWNDEAGIETITEIAVAGKPFLSIQGIGQYDAGEEQVKLSGLVDDVGFAAFEWLSTVMALAQWSLIIGTVLNGRRSGRVTVRTRLNDGTWVTRNAILTMQKKPGESRVNEYYTDVIWRFTRVHELAA